MRGTTSRQDLAETETKVCFRLFPSAISRACGEKATSRFQRESAPMAKAPTIKAAEPNQPSSRRRAFRHGADDAGKGVRQRPRQRRAAKADRHQPASGRSHMLMAAAYQRMGRIDEANAAMLEGLRLRHWHDGAQFLAADQERQPGFPRGESAGRPDNARCRIAGTLIDIRCGSKPAML
jgi:hypothetical protein